MASAALVRRLQEDCRRGLKKVEALCREFDEKDAEFEVAASQPDVEHVRSTGIHTHVGSKSGPILTNPARDLALKRLDEVHRKLCRLKPQVEGWLGERELRPLADAGHYLIFDTPGQAELYSCHEGLSRIVVRMQRELDLQLASLHLVDSTLCASPFTFVAASLLSLQAMVRLELPHLNVLTKCDLRQELESADGAPSELRRRGGGERASLRSAAQRSAARARVRAYDDT